MVASAGYSESQQVDLRSLYVDKTVTGFAEASYKFKQVLTISPTTAWKNTFIREDPAVLSGQVGAAVKGVPRLGPFPNANKSWGKVQGTIIKYGLEAEIAWEDILSDDVDVQERTMRRVAEGVAKAIDDQIWVELGGTGVTAGINSFSILGRGWDEASGTIIDDIGKAIMLISQNNYPIDSIKVLINPKQRRSIMNYVAEKGAQFPSLGTQAATNGYIGTLAGADFIVSNSVTASNILVVVPQRCATWKSLVPMKTTTIEDPYIKLKIRTVEEGMVELTNPLAICLIIGTDKNAN